MIDQYFTVYLNHMPKLLLFAYPFPPSPAIGAVRAWAMAKYLSRAGWEVTVVTPKLQGFSASLVADAEDLCRMESIRVVHTGTLIWPTSLINTPWQKYPQVLIGRCVSKMLRWFGIGRDELWLLPALRASLNIQPRTFDLVLATGSPFSSFIAAWYWARRLSVPFVLDYRDPWSLNTLGSNRGKLSRWMEQRIIAKAERLIMVSPSQAARQQQAFNLDQPPLVLTNGFDPELLTAVSGKLFQEFVIVYAGEFYKGQREVDPLLVALKHANEKRGESGNFLRLHYYGSAGDYVGRKARQFGVESLVVCHGRVSRAEVLSAIKGSDVTAVITGVSEHADLVERGIVTGKLFEPLGLGVPVLMIAPEGSDAIKILENAGAGQSFRACDTTAMADWLIEKAEEPRGARCYPPPVDCSWPVLAKRLDEEMRTLVLRQAVSVQEIKPQ